MKIISLALLHKGFLDNRRAIQTAIKLRVRSITPYPECVRPNDRISFIKVELDGQIYQARIFTDAETMLTWGLDEEYFKHFVYLNLQDEVFNMLRAEFNKQANKILGDKVECI